MSAIGVRGIVLIQSDLSSRILLAASLLRVGWGGGMSMHLGRQQFDARDIVKLEACLLSENARR